LERGSHRKNAAFRLFSIWWRPARLHRSGIRHDGSDAAARNDRSALPNASRAKSARQAAGKHHPAPQRRNPRETGAPSERKRLLGCRERKHPPSRGSIRRSKRQLPLKIKKNFLQVHEKKCAEQHHREKQIPKNETRFRRRGNPEPEWKCHQNCFHAYAITP